MHLNSSQTAKSVSDQTSMAQSLVVEPEFMGKAPHAAKSSKKFSNRCGCAAATKRNGREKREQVQILCITPLPWISGRLCFAVSLDCLERKSLTRHAAPQPILPPGQEFFLNSAADSCNVHMYRHDLGQPKNACQGPEIADFADGRWSSRPKSAQIRVRQRSPALAPAPCRRRSLITQNANRSRRRKPPAPRDHSRCAPQSTIRTPGSR